MHESIISTCTLRPELVHYTCSLIHTQSDNIMTGIPNLVNTPHLHHLRQHSSDILRLDTCILHPKNQQQLYSTLRQHRKPIIMINNQLLNVLITLFSCPLWCSLSPKAEQQRDPTPPSAASPSTVILLRLRLEINHEPKNAAPSQPMQATSSPIHHSPCVLRKITRFHPSSWDSKRQWYRTLQMQGYKHRLYGSPSREAQKNAPCSTSDMIEVQRSAYGIQQGRKL
jgi:hypothetical protein